MVGSTETLTVCEPGRLEEDVMMGKMVIGVNAYREVCTLHLAGQVDSYRGILNLLSDKKDVQKQSDNKQVTKKVRISLLD